MKSSDMLVPLNQLAGTLSQCHHPGCSQGDCDAAQSAAMTELPFSGPAERNKQPILHVLAQVLPARGRALEIASGTGQHVAWFAKAMPRWTWQPTDADEGALPAIAARIAQEQLANVNAPLQLDVIAASWPVPPEPFDAIYCANMLHISPWPACTALMRGSAMHLARDGLLVTYGPYLEDDVPTAPGNLAFDASLRARNALWGIRTREEVEEEARCAGLALRGRHAMPANNLLLVFGRAG
jgi:SAM-dependent methyltransferase